MPVGGVGAPEPTTHSWEGCGNTGAFAALKEDGRRNHRVGRLVLRRLDRSVTREMSRNPPTPGTCNMRIYQTSRAFAATKEGGAVSAYNCRFGLIDWVVGATAIHPRDDACTKIGMAGVGVWLASPPLSVCLSV